MTEEEQKWQQMYMQFQMIQQQMEQIAQHLEQLNQRNAELEISKNAIEEVVKTPVDNEIMAPVANGIFIKTKLVDNQTFVVNVGANTTVEKTGKEVVELLDKHQKEILERIGDAQNVLQDLQIQSMKISEAVGE